MKCLKCFSFFKNNNKSTIENNKENITQQINKVLNDDSEIIKLDMNKIDKDKSNNFFTPFRLIHNTNKSKKSEKENKLKILQSINNKRPLKSNKKKTKIIFEFKDKLRCIFCGGGKCKHENYLNNLKNSNAIEGLNSNYITESIIASQRPSEALILKYNLIQVFKDLNIGLIINLQREGEHPYCGPNAYHLTSSGYSYNPSVFSGNDIICKLFGWKDMTTPSTLNFMLDIVKEMTVAIQEFKKKVLVHCHAGYGRTGVVIACYLIFNCVDINAKEIILQVRKKRKKCIENKKQVRFCYKFAEFISHIRTLFIEHTPKEKIETYLKFQEDLLYGENELIYGIVPILIVKCLEKIMKVATKYSLNNNQIYKIFIQANIPIKSESENIIDLLKQSINNNNWILFEKIENLSIIVYLLFDWFRNYVLFTINTQRTSKIISNELFPEIYYVLQEKKGKIIELCKLIKTGFYSYEYETLYCIALFAANYIPLKDEEDKNNFQGMIDVFSIALLGYDYNKITSKKKEIENFEDTKKIITGLSTIIEFLVLTMTFFQEGNINENNYIDLSRLSSISHSIHSPSPIHLRTLRRFSKYNLYYSNVKRMTSNEEELKHRFAEFNHLSLNPLEEKGFIKNTHKSNCNLQDFSKHYYSSYKKDLNDNSISPHSYLNAINTLNKVNLDKIQMKKSIKSMGKNIKIYFPQEFNKLNKNTISNISEEKTD